MRGCMNSSSPTILDVRATTQAYLFLTQAPFSSSTHPLKMRSFILVAASLLAVLGSATVLPKREIWQSPFTGEIVAPLTNEVIVEDVAFPFNYKTSSWCQASFEPFEVYLTQGEAPPPFEDVTEDGVMADGSYVYDFGRFVVSHFGKSPSSAPLGRSRD